MGLDRDYILDSCPVELEPYSDAFRMKLERENMMMWYQGQYFYAALDATVCNCMPFIKRRKKGEYPPEPMRITPKTEEDRLRDEERELQKLFSFLGNVESNVKRKNNESK